MNKFATVYKAAMRKRPDNTVSDAPVYRFGDVLNSGNFSRDEARRYVSEDLPRLYQNAQKGITDFIQATNGPMATLKADPQGIDNFDQATVNYQQALDDWHDRVQSRIREQYPATRPEDRNARWNALEKEKQAIANAPKVRTRDMRWPAYKELFTHPWRALFGGYKNPNRPSGWGPNNDERLPVRRPDGSLYKVYDPKLGKERQVYGYAEGDDGLGIAEKVLGGWKAGKYGPGTSYGNIIPENK